MGKGRGGEDMSTNKPAGGAQFTPGPWAVNKSDTCLIMVSKSMGMGAEKHIADVQYNEERYANAHLIAAAPAMYAELVAGLVLLEASYQDMCGKYGTDSLHAQTVWERVERTRQVIAQAEGRQG